MYYNSNTTHTLPPPPKHTPTHPHTPTPTHPHTSQPKILQSSDGFNRALALKDRLVQYDNEHAQRTKVYDDESDYYSSTVTVWNI